MHDVLPRSAPCWLCENHTPDVRGEWQCWDCHCWWYVSEEEEEGRLLVLPVYDRVPTADQMTQAQQGALDDARRFLEARGQRFMVDFGYQNAIAHAEALGYGQEGTMDVEGLTRDLLADPEIRAAYGASTLAYDAGALVVRARTAAHLSQAELAARIGGRPASVRKLERGETNPTLGRLGSLLAAMGWKAQLTLVPLVPEPPHAP